MSGSSFGSGSVQRAVLFPQFLRYRLAGFEKGGHLRIELAKSPLPIIRSETLDRPIEIRAAGFGVGKTDDPRALGTSYGRKRRRYVTIVTEQREDIARLHQLVRLLADSRVNAP